MAIGFKNNASENWWEKSYSPKSYMRVPTTIKPKLIEGLTYAPEGLIQRLRNSKNDTAKTLAMLCALVKWAKWKRINWFFFKQKDWNIRLSVWDYDFIISQNNKITLINNSGILPVKIKKQHDITEIINDIIVNEPFIESPLEFPYVPSQIVKQRHESNIPVVKDFAQLHDAIKNGTLTWDVWFHWNKTSLEIDNYIFILNHDTNEITLQDSSKWLQITNEEQSDILRLINRYKNKINEQ